jgi:hypothetical protein
VKVYVRHHRCTPDDLESAARAGAFHRPGAVLRFVEIVTPDCQVAFERRNPLTCLAFVPGSDGVVTAATTHLPINSYAPDDATIERRITSYLAELGLDANSYVRALRAYANRSLQDSIGAQSYVSLQAGPKLRLTVYLAAEAYRPGTIAPASTRAISCDLEQLVDRFERREPITDHPFLRRLRSHGGVPGRVDIPRSALRDLLCHRVELIAAAGSAAAASAGSARRFLHAASSPGQCSWRARRGRSSSRAARTLAGPEARDEHRRRHRAAWRAGRSPACG